MFKLAVVATIAASAMAQAPAHWSDVCIEDIEAICGDVLTGEACADIKSGSCKSGMFNCIDVPENVLTAACQEAVDARNQKAIDDAAAEAALNPPMEQYVEEVPLPPQQQVPVMTCPLPAMHVRSAIKATQCMTFNKKGAVPQIMPCKDSNVKQNFALVPSPDGVKMIYSPSPTEVLCMNDKAKFVECDANGGESFGLHRSHLQTVQLKLSDEMCLSTKGKNVGVVKCVDGAKGKATKKALKGQSFYVEPTIGA